MNLITCCLLLYSVSFSKASANIYKTVYESDFCTLGNTPVCGTNGHEYFLLENTCEFNAFNSKQLEKGQMILSKTTLESCFPPAPSLTYNLTTTYKTYCPQYCNKAFKPLCASYRNVQRNFTNECLLKKHICETKENWQIVLNGTCVSVNCPLNGQEVCASYNGYNQSFPNLLSLYGDIQTTGKNWEIRNVGPCPCPKDYRPICAQLNCTAKTFTNECFLERAIENGEEWSILLFGECPDLPTTTTTSPEDGSENITEGVESGDGPLDIDSAINNTTKNTNNTEKAKPVSGNRPVYIIKKNQITPYMPQNVYQNIISAKPIDYASYNLVQNYEKPINKKCEGIKLPEIYSDSISFYMSQAKYQSKLPPKPMKYLTYNMSSINKDSYEQPPRKEYEDVKPPETYNDPYELPPKKVYEDPSTPTKNYYVYEKPLMKTKLSPYMPQIEHQNKLPAKPFEYMSNEYKDPKIQYGNVKSPETNNDPYEQLTKKMYENPSSPTKTYQNFYEIPLKNPQTSPYMQQTIYENKVPPKPIENMPYNMSSTYKEPYAQPPKREYTDVKPTVVYNDPYTQYLNKTYENPKPTTKNYQNSYEDPLMNIEIMPEPLYQNKYPAKPIACSSYNMSNDYKNNNVNPQKVYNDQYKQLTKQMYENPKPPTKNYKNSYESRYTPPTLYQNSPSLKPIEYESYNMSNQLKDSYVPPSKKEYTDVTPKAVYNDAYEQLRKKTYENPKPTTETYPDTYENPYKAQTPYQNKPLVKPMEYKSSNMSNQYKDSYDAVPKKNYGNVNLPETYNDQYNQLTENMYVKPKPPTKNYQDSYEKPAKPMEYTSYSMSNQYKDYEKPRSNEKKEYENVKLSEAYNDPYEKLSQTLYEDTSPPTRNCRDSYEKPCMPQTLYQNNPTAKPVQYAMAYNMSNQYKNSYTPPPNKQYENVQLPDTYNDRYKESLNKNYQDSYETSVNKYQESPYRRQSYYQNKNSAKPADHTSYTSYVSNQYQDSYKQPPQKEYEKVKLPQIYKDSYEQIPQTMYKNINLSANNFQTYYNPLQSNLYTKPLPDIYSKTFINYKANASPPDYQSFFKPLNAPIAASAVSIMSSTYNNNDYYAPKMVTDTSCRTSYPPRSYSDMTSAYYGKDDDSYDSGYESFT